MENNSSEKATYEIDVILRKLVDFSNKSEYDYNIYNSFAVKQAKTFEDYFIQIKDEAIKEKIISNIKHDFHFSIDGVVNNMLAKKITIDNPEPGETYFIGGTVPDTRVVRYKDNYEKLIALFFNYIEFQKSSLSGRAPGNRKKPEETLAFKLGLLFAEKKIFKKVITLNNIKSTTYNYENEAFINPNQLSKHIGISHQYVNDSFKGANTKHNIFNSIKTLKAVIDHCNQNKKIIDEEFTNKYNALVENKQ